MSMLSSANKITFSQKTVVDVHYNYYYMPTILAHEASNTDELNFNSVYTIMTQYLCCAVCCDSKQHKDYTAAPTYAPLSCPP